jgi:SAM-dependent methyltransferase
MSESTPQPKRINELLNTVYPSFALLAGMELDLFTPLQDGPLGADQLAGAIGVPASKLKPLLYTLVAAGLLTVGDGQFSNTPEASAYLVRGKPTYMGGKSDLISKNWVKVLRTAETIRAGGPLAEYYEDPTRDDLVALLSGLYPSAIQDAQRLMELFNFSKYRSLLDVGGGSGGMAIALVQANPDLTAAVFDLPAVTPITQQFVDQNDVGDRIEVLPGDAVHGLPAGPFDAIVARHFIQVLSEKENLRFLKNAARVIKPGGVIYIIGWILDNSRLTPENAVGFNLVLLNDCQDGQVYTEHEYQSWLDEAGFVEFERLVLPGGESIVTARKPE